MHKGLILLAVLSCICFVIQLLPVISVPITGSGTNYNLHLSLFNNNTFGVFGLCDLDTITCSRPGIGYPSKDSAFFELSSSTDYDDQFGGIELPSKATYTISKLLVVHVLGFCLSSLLLILIVWLIVILDIDESKPKSDRTIFKLKYKVLDRPDFDESKVGQGLQSSSSKKRKKKRDITPFLNWMLVLSLLSFLLTLLAFLVDILLFIPHLSYLGWIQLLPVIVLPIEASIICFSKRSISSRKYFEDDYKKINNDDMRIRKKVDITRWNEDSASDDGFYVYTNGFYSNYNDNSKSGTPGSLENNRQSGWIRHTPHDDTGDEGSIDSNQINNSNFYRDNIELDSFDHSSVHIHDSTNSRDLC